MSTTRAREVLQDFLKSDFDEVLALKGKWGTGKTYTWVHLVNSAASDNQIAKPNYAYVSLFGINSLESLKNALFENTIESELIKDGPSLHTVANNFTKIFNREEYTEHENSWLGKIWSKSKPVRKIAQAQAKKSLPHIENLPILKDFFPFLRSASFLSVRNTIICIDDFERKGDSLNAKDIFGLITVLKEQRNCKVAIILNDDSLQGDEAEAYSKYREKVIDIELTFEPSAEECADLIFYGDSKPNKLVKEKSIKLNIKNIRILQRIKRLTDNINHELEQYDDEVAYNVFHGLTLMGWCFYSGEGDAPPLDYIKELSYQHHGLLPEEKKITDNEKSWNALLRSYDYQTTDELDLELAKYVEQGYYDVEDLHDKLKKLNDQIIANKSGNSFTQAWEHYHNTFADNADELIETLKDRLIENARHISPRNLNGTVTLFRELGKEELADEL